MIRRAATVGAVVIGVSLLAAAPEHRYEVPTAIKNELVVTQSQTAAPARPEPVQSVTLSTTGSSVYVPPEPPETPAYDPCARDEWGVLHNDDCMEAMGY